MSQTQSRGIFYMLACAFLWSIGGLFIKLIDWNPFFIAGARSLIGAAVLMVYMKLAHLSLKINRRSIVSGIALCSVFFCYVTANKLTTAANTVVLQYTNPVFVVLLSSLFLHQKFSRRDLFLVGTVFFGGHRKPLPDICKPTGAMLEPEKTRTPSQKISRKSRQTG